MRATVGAEQIGLRVVGRLLSAAVLAVVLCVVVGQGTAGAETIDEQVSREVSLDQQGTSTVEAFDPARGTLTEVSVRLDVAVLVQACVENRQEEGTAPSAGTVSGRLVVALPSGDEAVASANVALPSGDLTASDGSADCSDGFATDQRRFPAPVSSPDSAYAERADQAEQTVTLTAAEDLEAFSGPGTVAITHTPASDSELAVPAAWDAVSVGSGTYEVDVTYTYTPAAGGSTVPPSGGSSGGSTGGSSGGSTGGTSGDPGFLAWTGARAAEVSLVGAALVLLGGTAVACSRLRRRTSNP